MEVDKVIVMVFTKTNDDVSKYFRLFRFMIGDNKITKSFLSKYHAKIETDKFEIRFVVAGKAMLGKRAHYVINMYPDEQYDNEVAMPMMVLHNHLKEDPKWSELFEENKQR